MWERWGASGGYASLVDGWGGGLCGGNNLVGGCWWAWEVVGGHGRPLVGVGGCWWVHEMDVVEMTLLEAIGECRTL